MPKLRATSLHSGDTPNQQAGRSGSAVREGWKANLLIDPQNGSSGFTHSDQLPKYKGPRRVSAAVTDEELGGPLNTHGEHDPSGGYLDTGSDLPMIDVPVSAEFDEDGEFDDLTASDDADDDGEDDDSEFEDLPDLDEEPAPVDAGDEGGDLGEVDFPEDDAPMEETLALVDVDETADDMDSADLQFACTASAVHVMSGNRIIASMGPSAARKAGVSDIYTQPVFQDAVMANVEQMGLRKGLVQSGLTLARVRLKAAKVTSRVLSSRVEAATAQYRVQAKQQQEVLAQSMAIAAVGINANYFKGVQNELKAALETELANAGVRGATRLVSSVFAQHGVAYAHSIVTLAQRLAAMSDDAREGYVAALDMVSDEAAPESLDIDGSEEEFDEDDMEPLGATSVSAALLKPVHRTPAQINAHVGSDARRILAGSQSLI